MFPTKNLLRPFRTLESHMADGLLSECFNTKGCSGLLHPLKVAAKVVTTTKIIAILTIICVQRQ